MKDFFHAGWCDSIQRNAIIVEESLSFRGNLAYDEVS